MFLVEGLWSLVCLLVNVVGASEENVYEYCHFETFRASCPEGEAILMRSAFYGRKSLGRCVRTNFGFIGCYSDVLEFLDRRCSAKRSCEFEVIEPNFDDIRPCNVELKSYLEAQYTCITVAEDLMGNCEVNIAYRQPIALPRPDAFHCGSETSPWKLKVPPGQRINITLFEFTPLSTTVSPTITFPHSYFSSSLPLVTGTGVARSYHPPRAMSYARIREPELNRGGEAVDIRAFLASGRQSHVHTTATSLVEVIINLSGSNNFLLTFTAVGCPDVQASPEMTVRYSADRNTAKVVCKNSEQSWRLVCTERGWHGYTGNCSAQLAKIHSMPNNNFSQLKTSTVMVASIVVGVSVTISLCILFIGLLILKRVKGHDVTSASHTDQLVVSCQLDVSPVADYQHDHPAFYHHVATKSDEPLTLISHAEPVTHHCQHVHEDLLPPSAKPIDCPYSLLRLSQRPLMACLCRYPTRDRRGVSTDTNSDPGNGFVALRDRYGHLGTPCPCFEIETERLVADDCSECVPVKVELENLL